MNIAKIIDQTNIKLDASVYEINKTATEAQKYGFRGLCVRPKWVKLAKKLLSKTQIKIVCLVDPPIGDSPHQKRVNICQKAKKDGADELDIIMPLPEIKHEKWNKILLDLKKICCILPTKVIIGSGYLTDEEIIKASEISKKAKAICVKTTTEKDPLERRELKEKLRHLKLMKQSAPDLLIKASGNIKNFNDAIMSIRAGADIIGTSYGVKIAKRKK